MQPPEAQFASEKRFTGILFELQSLPENGHLGRMPPFECGLLTANPSAL
jgi:hypothetical protein